jgi:hypothetical protein
MQEALIIKKNKMSILKRKSTQYILLALLIIAGIGGIYGYKEYNRTAKDIALVAPAFTTSSNVIVDEFTKNDSIANVKYLGKTIAINGLLKTIDKDENGFFTIVMGDTTSSTSVRCSMDSIHNNEASSLKAGTQINVKGICTGYNKDEMGLGADIILNHSCINKTQ